MLRRYQCLGVAPLRAAAALLALFMAVGQAATQPAPGPSGGARKPTTGTVDQAAKSAATVIAEVDGRAITLGDVHDAIAALPSASRDLPFADLFPALQAKLVRQEALVIRAQRRGLDEDPVVRRRLKQATDQILADALLEDESGASITEAALLDRYQRSVAGKPGPEEVHVRVLMLPTEPAALGVIAELHGGADFATLARRSSIDATAPAGGDVGFVLRSGLTPEIGAVVFSMQPGQITPFPVLSGGAWFVLKVEERRRQPTRAFLVEREDLRQAMLQEGVASVLGAAMADVAVREYDFTGKETASAAANAIPRALK